ncbi:EKC/KEOPS complex subunit Lage3 [Fukomys damarensis]|uniref:L antigen family member 3 n=1 Tax=Fukomys damarensis TaxID=885580 RepID=A0A091CNK6_FUKDA|nr:EKC/KEOPS complex subunit Lage3 [Fukomys damarensis]KFO19108.1 L antigen family member 3 [Fukomys damarensis]
MAAHDGGAGGGEGQGDDQGDPSQGIFADVAAEEGIDLGEVSQIVVIPHGVGSGGPAVLVVSRMGPHQHEFYLRVPFLSSIEAEITRRSLAPLQDTAEIHRELTVNGCLMRVRWVSEDLDCLHALFSSFLEDLCAVFQIMELLRPFLTTIVAEETD